MDMKWPDSTDFRQRAENTLFSLARFDKYLENCVFHYEQPLAGLISPISASGGLGSCSVGVSGEVHAT